MHAWDEKAAGEMTGLVRVDDDALADDRIERAVEHLDDARLLLDVPAQQAVVRVDEAVGFDRLARPTAQRSHQYGECSAWAWCAPRGFEPRVAQLRRAARLGE